ncbi:hypothetical protein MVEN_00441500 [Mycena venus]|uniref:Uncharacterized protein n=1 Tax=Mycena venus TaxID=2733690 RepID=A0A8H6YSV2_9AGAR|nr:hypothetical protein MVEN_00441500 [Mycena venus]
MLVPGLHEEAKLLVYLMQEKVVQKPDVVDVIDVEPMPHLKKSKQIRPSCPNLGRNIAPQSFYAYIVDTPARLETSALPAVCLHPCSNQQVLYAVITSHTGWDTVYGSG